MAIGLRFDKGVSAGTANQSREDFAVGEVCTIVATGIVGTATFDILAPPLGSTAALVPVDPLSQTITIDVAGRWEIRVGDTADGSRTERTFASPSLLRGLIPPAHNETASPDANAADVDPGTWVDESKSNLGGRTTGHAPDLQKAVNAIELNADLALGARETGWLSGGVITINGSNPAQYDVASGTIRVQGVVDPVPFPAFIGVDPPNLATRPFTDNAISAAATLLQTDGEQATVEGAERRRNNAVLQQIQHVDNATITGISLTRQTSENQTQELIDLHFFSGPRNKGNDYTPAASDLTVQKTEGLTALPGLSAVLTPQSPAYQANDADPAVTFLLVHRDGAGGFVITNDTDIPVGFWDNNEASLSSTPKYVIYQMHFFNNVSICVPGQNTYNTLSDATAALLTEQTLLQPDLEAVLNTYRTAIIANGMVTDINNATFIAPPEGT